MKKKAGMLILSSIIMIIFLWIEHASAEKTRVHISHLEKSIYRITYKLPYTFVHLASIGKDGTFLIDAGAESTAQELLHKLKKIGKGKTIKQIVESSIFDDYKDWLRKEDWVEVIQKQKTKHQQS